MSSEVLTKPLEWQKKLVYCMNEELFEICIDTLRSFTTPESKQMILDNPSILYRVNDLLPKVGIAVKEW
ncbi:hypothetical protein [Paenibacillus glacialis]|uniref:hypothetical protein n=1 Tax=Paenibacillus glacialis TaxID=494026 RepID=UPI001FDF26F3|nr:hypothetical protein [Paenibacillus glacialis]